MPTNRRNVSRASRFKASPGHIKMTKLAPRKQSVLNARVLEKTRAGDPYGWEAFPTPDSMRWGIRISIATIPRGGVPADKSLRFTMATVSQAAVTNYFDVHSRYTDGEINAAILRNDSRKPLWLPVRIVSHMDGAARTHYSQMVHDLMRECEARGLLTLVRHEEALAVRSNAPAIITNLH